MPRFTKPSHRPTRVGALTGLAFLGVLATATAEGCGTEAVEGGAACTYEETVPCQTDAGCEGQKTCLPDLSGYGPCTCSDGGTASGGSGGATSTDGGT